MLIGEIGIRDDTIGVFVNPLREGEGFIEELIPTVKEFNFFYYTLGHGFSVNASVNNLFDTQYAYSEGFIEEGRNFWAGVEYTF